MAETSTAAMFPTNAEFQKYWDEMVAANPIQKVTYNPVTVDEVTADSAAQKIQSWLNPYVDNSVKSRQAATKASTAELAADAYSRGMGASTWLSDQNARQLNAEAADVATIKSNAAMTLAQGVADELTAYRTRKLQADTTNASNALNADLQNKQLEEDLKNKLWSRFIDQFNMGLYTVPQSGSTYNPKPDNGDLIIDLTKPASVPTPEKKPADYYSGSASKFSNRLAMK